LVISFYKCMYGAQVRYINDYVNTLSTLSVV
jgi:hypothetical protein